MNPIFRKLKKNSKALSPVVASIILIAVTVAVSVVVAAWMGGTALNLMGNAEQVTVTNAQCIDDHQITVSVRNTGSDTVTISSATIDGNSTVITSTDIAKGTTGSITVSATAGTFASGAQYEVKLLTAKGTTIICNAVYSGQ